MKKKLVTTLSLPKGFTLIEVLIVVSILAILTAGVLFSLNKQRLKADDTRAKSDLSLLKIAFENYYNDHGCYPPAEWFDAADDCGTDQFKPYLSSIPCDKNTGRPYVLETDETSCVWFKLYATFSLPSSDEQAIAQRSPSGSQKGNYGVSSSNVSVTVFYEPTTLILFPSPNPSPLPSPSEIPHIYYCQNIGNCTLIGTNQTCTPSYTNPDCDGGTNKCSQVSICN